MSRLLIVDDEERIRDIIKKYAQFEGFETVEAVDGLQAVEICRKESFDLIIKMCIRDRSREPLLNRFMKKVSTASS